MDAREYLLRIAKNKCIIANKQKDKMYFEELATGITSSVGGERVQTSASNRRENHMIEVAQIDAEIKKLKEEIKEIISTMERLRVSEYDFLHKIYVEGMSLKEVHTVYRKSYSWATSMHQRALESLQQILDE